MQNNNINEYSDAFDELDNLWDDENCSEDFAKELGLTHTSEEIKNLMNCFFDDDYQYEFSKYDWYDDLVIDFDDNAIISIFVDPSARFDLSYCEACEKYGKENVDRQLRVIDEHYDEIRDIVTNCNEALEDKDNVENKDLPDDYDAFANDDEFDPLSESASQDKKVEFSPAKDAFDRYLANMEDKNIALPPAEDVLDRYLANMEDKKVEFSPAKDAFDRYLANMEDKKVEFSPAKDAFDRYLASMEDKIKDDTSKTTNTKQTDTKKMKATRDAEKAISDFADRLGREDESLNNSKKLKDAKSDLKTENNSKSLTLNEEADAEAALNQFMSNLHEAAEDEVDDAVEEKAEDEEIVKGLTVGELIEKLKEFDEDKIVLVHPIECGEDAEPINLDLVDADEDDNAAYITLVCAAENAEDKAEDDDAEDDTADEIEEELLDDEELTEEYAAEDEIKDAADKLRRELGNACTVKYAAKLNVNTFSGYDNGPVICLVSNGNEELNNVKKIVNKFFDNSSCYPDKCKEQSRNGDWVAVYYSFNRRAVREIER